jgi:hypothetical protein
MVDDLVITLIGNDETAAMWKDSTKNAKEYIKAMERLLQLGESGEKALRERAKQTKRDYSELLEIAVKSSEKYIRRRQGEQQVEQQQQQQFGKTKAAAEAVAGAIGNMAMKYASVTKAIEIAKDSFLGFAEGEKKLLILQNRFKMTGDEMDRAEAKLKTVSRTTRTGFDESLDAAVKLKSGLNTTLDSVIAKTARLNVIAKGLNVLPQDFAEITNDFMRTMNIPANQFNQTMEIVAGMFNDLGVDINQLKGQSDILGETARQAGLKGANGFAELAVELGIASKEFGGTTKGARALTSLMAELGSAKTGEMFNIPGNIWIEQLENFKKEGGNAVVFALGHFKQLRTEQEKQIFLRKLGDKDRLLFSKMLEKDNGEIAKQIDGLNKLKDGNAAVAAGRKIWESNSGSVDDLTASLKGLSEEFGKLVAALGVAKAITIITEKMADLVKQLEAVHALIRLIKLQGGWGDAKTVGNALITPQERKAMRPSNWGKGGKLFAPGGNPFLTFGFTDPQGDAAKKLDEQLKESENQTAPGDFKNMPPGWRPTLPSGEEQGGTAPTLPAKPMSYQGGVDVPPGYTPISYREGEEESLIERGAVWIAGKLYKPRDMKVRTPHYGGGVRGSLGTGGGTYGSGNRESGPGVGIGGGVMPGGAQNVGYGGSADSKYLTADFRRNIQNASLGGGGGGGGGGSSSSDFQPAGPPGPGAGTGYGGQTNVPTAAAPADTAAPAGPEVGPGGVPAQPGTVAPVLPPELGGAAAAAPAAGATASGDYKGRRVNPEVMQTRLQQANTEWMKDPKNQQKIFRTLQAEGGGNIGANLEQMSNYAASRGLTLQQVVEARGKRQFYGPLRRFHGDPGSGPLLKHERDAYHSAWTPEKQKLWDKASKEVFSGGSNRINYLTDQGTVGDPNYDPNKMTKVGGNMFGIQPGTERWVGAQRGKAEVAGPVTVPGAAQTAAIPPGGAAQPLPPELGGPQPGAAPPPGATGVATGDRILPGRDLKGTDPRIRDILSHAAEVLPPGFKLRPTSGVRTSGQGQHTHGRAVDWEIVRPDGSTIRNRGEDVSGLYTKIAQAAYGYQEKYHPKLTGAFQWGGQFGTSAKNPNEPDLMHWDTGGRRGRITKYSRERIGAVLPPMPGSAAPVVASPPSQALRPTEPPVVQDDSAGASRPAQTSEEVTSRNEKVAVNLKVNDNDVQFARSTMRRQADKEVREARWNSYSDIGAA